MYRHQPYAQANHINYQQSNVNVGQQGQQYLSHQQQNQSYGMNSMSLSGNQTGRTYSNQQPVQQSMGMMAMQGQQSQPQPNQFNQMSLRNLPMGR